MKNQVSARRHAQSGSIFFWLFLVVILFAALSYALTSGFRGGASTLTNEKARLAATEIMDYGRVMRDGVKAMRISGVPLRLIDFRSATLTRQNGTSYSTPNMNCTNTSCQVFSSAGGAVPDRQFYEYGYEPSWWGATWSHVGGVEPALVKIEGIGTSLPELVFRVASVQENVCRAMNKLNGIDDRWPIEENYSGETYYAFSWDVDDALAQTDHYHFGQDVADFRNKIAFCTGSDGGDIYVLIEAR